MKNAICYSFGFFVEAIIIWLYSSNLFLPANNKFAFRLFNSVGFHKGLAKKRLVILTFLYLFLFTISIAEIKWLNAFLYIFVNFIYLFSQYQLNWFSALFHSAILTAIMSTCELIPFGILLRYSPHFFAESSYFRNLVILSVFSKLSFFFIIYIIIHFFKDKSVRNPFQTISAFLLSFIPITAVFVMITFVNIGENTALPNKSDWMVTSSAMLLLGISLLVFCLNQYEQKKHSEYTETLLLLQKEAASAQYYKMLLAQYDNQSILIHDIKKHLQSIDLLNDQYDHEKISAYIKQLLLSSDLKDVSKLCDHALLNAILCRYKKQCLTLHISFLTDIRSSVVDFMAENDITSLFCNLLDNAVEACQDIPDAYIEITAWKREKTPFVVITVINSCRNDPFSSLTQGNSRRASHIGLMPDIPRPSSKSDGQRHGFGLKSIRKTVDKYHGDIQMYYKDDAPAFHTIITLKYKTAEYG